MKEYNTEKSIKAQEEFCERTGQPLFAPNDGRCWRCHRNIYQEWTREEYGRMVTSGITVESAGSGLVTGCPHCYRSYCD